MPSSRRDRWQRRTARRDSPRRCLLRGQLPEARLRVDRTRACRRARDRRSEIPRPAPRRPAGNDSRHHARVAANQRHGNAARCGWPRRRRKLFDADRASIFLWDKPNKTIVGRPALGVEGGELRLPDDAGIVGQVVQTGEPRRVAGIERCGRNRSRRRHENRLSHQDDSLRAARLARRHAARRVRGAQQARRAIHRRGRARARSNWRRTPRLRWRTRSSSSDLLERQEQLVEQAAKDTLLVGESPAIQAVRSTIRRVADTDLAILILGENGTGKEVVARAIHYGSRRRKQPFIAVNCAALTETLLESELFGHEKGAFTDAHEARAGKFELASGGTLFLDEIGDMSLAGQAKLLRVLEEKNDRPRRRQPARFTPTSACSPRRIRSSPSWSGQSGSARTCTSGSTSCRSSCRRCASAATTSCCWPSISCTSSAARPAGARRSSPPPPASGSISHTWPGNVRELRNLMERLGVPLDRRQDRSRGPGVHPLAGRQRPVARRRRPLAQATPRDQFQTNYIQPIDRTGPRQRQPGRQKPRRPPLESLPQDAAARHGDRRRGRGVSSWASWPYPAALGSRHLVRV